MPEERLQKILARAGIASRRKAEELIQGGRVRVEGRIVTELGSKADSRAKIEVDGRRIEREQLCYGVFHKPRQMVTTLSDPEGRPTAQDVLRQVGVRVVPVGRLDFNTSGALLFTNDGDFAQGLSHAKSNVPKVYVATVQGDPDEKKLARWGESIDVEGKRTRPAEVRVLRREGDKAWLEITIREGKNRQVRRLAEHANMPVVRLARLSHAGITTEGLRPGEWRLLTVDELKELKKGYGVPEKIRGIMEVVPPRTAPRRAAPARPVRGRSPEEHSTRGSDERPERPARGGPRSRGAEERPPRGPRGGEERAVRGRGGEERPARGPRGAEERPTRGRPPLERPTRGARAEERPVRGRASEERPQRGARAAGPGRTAPAVRGPQKAPPGAGRKAATPTRSPRGSGSAPRPKKR